MAFIDVACIHAAGCDLATAHMGFCSATASVSGISMVTSLRKLLEKAQQEIPQCPGAGELFALMDLQLCRTLTACYLVRRISPCGEIG